ncbi:MAG: ATP-binding protein [bacterium]|nr:MAG: ATP-binding protein [bacterium]
MSWLARMRRNGASAGTLNGQAAPARRQVRRTKTTVWTIGGGKGGVGKTFMTSNFGAQLSGLGKKVLLVDADFGAANLHTFIKTRESGISLSSFLAAGNGDFKHTISSTHIPNLDIISGAKDSLDAADVDADGIVRLNDALRKVAHDHVILDVGPGTSSVNLNLFLAADEGILVTTPEPTSIENSYRFLKCLYSRRMREIVNSPQNARLGGLLKEILYKSGASGAITIAEIFSKVKRIAPMQLPKFRYLMGDGRVSIVINQARKPEDAELGPSMKKACYDYFGLNVKYLGHISYEDCVADSISQRKPLSVHNGESGAARSVKACLLRLLKTEKGILQ